MNWSIFGRFGICLIWWSAGGSSAGGIAGNEDVWFLRSDWVNKKNLGDIPVGSFSPSLYIYRKPINR